MRKRSGRSAVSSELQDERGMADAPLRSSLRCTTARRLRRLAVPGAQVAIRREGDLLWSACAGTLRLDPNRSGSTGRVDRRDRFVVASVTKLVVACTTLSLVERGELHLDDPVAEWIPDLPHSNQITARMLLGHRSGLPEYFRDADVRRKLTSEPLASWSRDELLDAVVRLGSERAPDQRLDYRNSNYIALGEILARRTGSTVADLMAERVSRPLGLTTMSFAGNETGIGRLAAPHRRRLGRPVDLLTRTDGHVPSHAIGEVWADGGLSSSAEDLAALTEGLFEGKLLHLATVQDMTRRYVSPGSAVRGVLGALQAIYLGPARRSYGLGVAIEQRASTTKLGHEGMYYGWSATTTYEPSTRTTVTVTTNLSGIPVPAERLERSLRAALSRSAPPTGPSQS